MELQVSLSKEEILERKREFYLVSVIESVQPEFWFGNGNPLHLEIGCGKGEFISVAARQHPEINFLGLELRLKRIDNTLRKLDPIECPNVRLARLLVDRTVSQLLPAGSFSRIYIQHPDPWPKRRHAKHRIIQPEFIDALHYLLSPGGIIEITIDAPEYRAWTLEHFRKRSDFEAIFPEGYTFHLPEGHIRTYFDEVQERAGFPTAYMEFRKRSEP